MYKSTAVTTEVLFAREGIYRLLAMAVRHPADQLKNLRDAYGQAFARAATVLLREEASGDDVPLGFGELHADNLDLEVLFGWINGPADDLFAEFDRVFGIGPTPDVPPYETEFCPNQEPFYRAQQMADVAGFYHAFGLQVTHERPDHIALQLEFMALLAMKERHAADDGNGCAAEWADICWSAQRVFIRDHLSWWVPSFAMGLRRKAGHGPYAAVANLLAALVPMERARFGVKTPWQPVRPCSEAPAADDSSCASCTSTS